MEWNTLKRLNEGLKTVDIKGKPYIEVNKRVIAFRELEPNGSISTEIVSFENGVVTMKATVTSANGQVLATGYAQEKETSSYINKTSFIENCVPLSTQILTQNGWKFFYQLLEEDKAWSYNLEKQEYEFTDIERVTVYNDKPIVRLETSRFDVKCTPAHKWVCTNQTKDVYKRETSELKVSDKIVQAFPQEVEASPLGKMLGWLMCDCEMSRTKDGMISTAYINQSKHVEEIKALFGEPRQTKRYSDSWMDNYEWLVPADKVRSILGAFGMADYKDLAKAMANAKLEDVKGCYETMMLADGSGGRFSSTYIELVEAMQVMCARLGIATTFITARMCKKSTKPIYELGIKRTTGAYFSEMVVTNLPPQDVWCPTTSTGTWVMRQGSFVTLTSNCETSAVGRALGFCGIGVDSSIASAEEVANAIHQQEQKPSQTKSKAPTRQTKPKQSEPKQLTYRDKVMIAGEERGLTPKQLAEKYGLSKDTTEERFEEVLADLEGRTL